MGFLFHLVFIVLDALKEVFLGKRLNLFLNLSGLTDNVLVSFKAHIKTTCLLFRIFAHIKNFLLMVEANLQVLKSVFIPFLRIQRQVKRSNQYHQEYWESSSCNLAGLTDRPRFGKERVKQGC